MKISKAEANLLSLNFLQKRTGRGLIEIKYGNKAYIIPILTYHIIQKSNLITFMEKTLITPQHRITVQRQWEKT